MTKQPPSSSSDIAGEPEAKQPESAHSGTNWQIVWVAFGAGVVAAAHIGKLPPALPVLRMDLEVGLIMAGWIASMISATGCGLGLVAGAFSDRLGHRRVLLFGLGCLAAGGFIGMLASSGWFMLMSRFIEGIGFTSTTIACAALIARATSDQDRKWALGVWAIYMPVGFAGMMLLAAGILEVGGWRIIWGVGGLISLAWLLVVARATTARQTDRDDRSQARSILGNVKVSLGQTGALLVAAAYALYAAQHISMMNWMPTYMHEVHQSSNLVAAGIPALILLFNGGGNYLAAWAMDRNVPLWLLLTLGSCGMVLSEIAIFSGSLPDSLKLFAALVFGVTGGLVPAAGLAAVPVYATSAILIASMNGVMVMASNTGQLFGPPALAAVRETTGSWDGTFGLIISMGIVMTLASVLSRTWERKAQAG